MSKDAELIRLCRQFVALEEARNRLFNDLSFSGHDDEDFLERATAPLVDRQQDILAKIKDMPTHTAEGIVARFSAFAAWSSMQGEEEDADKFDDMLLGPALRHASIISQAAALLPQ